MDILKIGSKQFDVDLSGWTGRSAWMKKYRVTTEDGQLHREIRGIYTDYSVEIGKWSKHNMMRS